MDELLLAVRGTFPPNCAQSTNVKVDNRVKAGSLAENDARLVSMNGFPMREYSRVLVLSNAVI